MNNTRVGHWRIINPDDRNKTMHLFGIMIDLPDIPSFPAIRLPADCFVDMWTADDNLEHCREAIRSLSRVIKMANQRSPAWPTPNADDVKEHDNWHTTTKIQAKPRSVPDIICQVDHCRYIGHTNDNQDRFCEQCEEPQPPPEIDDSKCPDCGKSVWWLPKCPLCGSLCDFLYGDLRERIREKHHWSKPIGR